MAHLLEFPRELLTFIFSILESPEAFSRTCRALHAFSKDPIIVSGWILNAPMSHRLVYAKKVFLKVAVLGCIFMARPDYLEPLDFLLADALECSRLDVAHWAIDKGADPSFSYDFPLKRAISVGDMHFLDYLVTERPVCITYGSLKYAVETSTREVVRYLFRHTSVSPRIYNDFLLRLAASYGKYHIVSYFISRGCNVHARHEQSLILSCTGGYTETVKRLLNAGANPRVRNGECLVRACRGGYEEIIHVLLNVGVNPDPGLLAAIHSKKSEIVRLLLSNGATLGTDHKKALREVPKGIKRDMGLLK